MTKFTRSLVGAVGLIGATALIAFGAAGVGAKSSGKADSGTAYTATTHSAGGFQYAAGNTIDKLYGAGAITFKIKVLTGPATGTFKLNVPLATYFFSNGSLTGSGSATLKIGAMGAATVTNGKASLTKGGGAQKGHSMKLTFTGTGNASTGLYTFNYKGTYK
jgi:hypothetical protein